MRAWQVLTLADAPRIVSIPDPQPLPGEVLVRVSAAGLNFADLLMLDGRYQEKPALPYIPGMEIAGVVEAVGPGTDGPQPGTRVIGVCRTGGLAEMACVPAAHLVVMPDAMPMTVGAGFQIAYGTSHLALTHKARLQPGETLLVTGAAGGVGLTAVEIGKRLGARVIASARGKDRLAVAKAAGADVVIDATAPDLKETLRSLGGVDVVYDTVGGPAFDKALSACKPDGRLLAIGFASGHVPQVPANVLLVKNLTVTGFWYGGYQKTFPTLVADSMSQLLCWYANGGLAPHISHVLPFDALAEGLDLLRNRTATGKVVINVA
ncbi:NADPH:quinone oxidoreductase family protein [Tabrizicola sp. BL-A-41-H6]|uniref:NADPH:quinone oxidoreductase family protein n=1 Tax=Tabrizicola sp. BL-A-41-H6 TaxID=3421107 RepID=UPI003D674828